MKSFTHENAKGVNYINENLPPNVSPYSKNVDTEKGLWAKRAGLYSLITSLGANPIKSMFRALMSAGETLFLNYSTALYKLSGTESSVVRTTDANFNAGTLSNTAPQKDTLYLSPDETDTEDHITQLLYPTNTASLLIHDIGQGFTLSAIKAIYSIHAWSDNEFGESDTITVTIYESTSKETTYGSASNTGRDTYDGFHEFVFDTPVVLVAGTYYMEFTSSDVCMLTHSDSGVYAGGSFYDNRVEDGDKDLTFKITTCAFEASGSYISETIDLGQTPAAASIAFTSAGTVAVSTRGSIDGSNWGEWGSVSTGDGIPLKRYIQVKAEFTNTTTPSLSDWTITYTPTFDTATSIATTLTDTVRYQDYDGKLYFASGDYPQVYNGTASRVLGVDAPATTCTNATGDAGSLTGDYYYKITYVNADGVEGNPSTASAKVSPSSQKVDLSAIPTSSGMNRRIYRTLAGGAVYYLLTEIEDDTTTTYEDNIADATIEDTSGALQIDNFKPPKATIVYEHKGYMFYVDATDESKLWFSKVYGTDDDKPLAAFEQVPSTNWKKLPGDIKGMIAYEGKLVVSGENFSGFFTGSIWGGSSDNTVWTLVDDMGVTRQEALCICQASGGTYCVMLTKGGVRFFTPTIYEGSLERRPLSYEIQPYIDNGDFSKAWCVFYNSRLYVGFIHYTDTPIAYDNVVFAYDFKRNVWDGPWYMGVACACTYDNLLYGGDSQAGKLYEMLRGSDDAGADIDMECDLRGDFGKYTATVEKVRLHATTDSVTDDLSFNMEVGSVSKTVSTGAKSTWKQSGGSYGQQDLMEKKLSIKKRGKFYGIRIEDDSANPVEIRRVILEIDGIREV